MCAACSIISVLTQWGATLVIKIREREMHPKTSAWEGSQRAASRGPRRLTKPRRLPFLQHTASAPMGSLTMQPPTPSCRPWQRHRRHICNDATGHPGPAATRASDRGPASPNAATLRWGYSLDGCYSPVLVDGGGGTRIEHARVTDGGAEDKLRGVSVRHSCAFKGLDQRSRHTAQEGWAIDAGPSMNEASGQRI